MQVQEEKKEEDEEKEEEEEKKKEKDYDDEDKRYRSGSRPFRRKPIKKPKEHIVSLGPLLTPKRLLPLSVEAALLIGSLIGVRAEEVSLSLREVLRKISCTIAIKVAKRCGESDRWNSS